MGLFNRLTTYVLETAPEAEVDEDLGDGKHDVSGCGGWNSLNSTSTKSVMTEIDPKEINVPQDTGLTLDPQILKKR